jgi:Amt family ammonium transporter
MVRSRNALNVIMLVAASSGAMTVAWVLVGFSLAYGPDSWSGLLGSLDHAGLVGIANSAEFSQLSIPPIGLAMFHLSVALVASVVVTVVAVERVKFGALLSFMLIWSVVVYPTAAHWVLGQDGWLANWGVLDFGSGTLIGVTSAASALALTLVMGRRRGINDARPVPHNLPLALGGAGLAWVGWIGVTAGSAFEAGGVAASAALATHVAAVGGLAGAILIEKRVSGVVTASGAAWGGLSGLAAITPAAGYLDPFASILLGFVAGVATSLIMSLRRKIVIDDPLGSVRVFGLASVLGMVFVGLFGRLIVGTDTEPVGALLGGSPALLGKQVVAVVAIAAFAFVASWIIAAALRAAMGLRVTPEAEDTSIDRHQHGESAYSIRD